MNERIPVLAVRQPWAGLIASGKKINEVRGYPAPKKYIGQKIAIYASKTRPVSTEVAHCLRMNYRLSGSYSLPSLCMDRGVIIATATLESSLFCMDSMYFSSRQNEHWNPIEYYRTGKTYYWMLENINPATFRDYSDSHFVFPHGATVWSSIEADKLAKFMNEGP